MVDAPVITIRQTKIEALVDHEIRVIGMPNTRRIYTDGSGLPVLQEYKEIGAAAVCLDPLTTVEAYIGTEHKCTVPVAEIAGLVLALRMARDNGWLSSSPSPPVEI